MLVCSLFANSPGDLIITEFFFKSDGDICDYIEIFNTTNSSINLDGWSLIIDGDVYTINHNDCLDCSELNLIIYPQKYFVLTGERGYFSNNASPAQFWLAENDSRRDPNNDSYEEGFDSATPLNGGWRLEFRLSTNSDQIIIQDPSGTAIDEINYDNDTSWPTGSENRGRAAEFILNPLSDSPHIGNDTSYYWESSHFNDLILFNEIADFIQIGNQEYGSPIKPNFSPTNFQVNAADSESFTLSWSNPYPDYGVTGYILKKEVSSSQEFFDLDVSDTSFYDNNILDATLYIYSLTSTDIYGITSDPTPSLYLARPYAYAGEDFVINMNIGQSETDVFLDGDHDDPEENEYGDELTFEWKKNNVIIANSEDTTISLDHGVHDFIFRVTDSHGAYDEDDLQIIVIASLVADASATDPDNVGFQIPHDGFLGGEVTVTLDGTNSSVNVEGLQISRYSWIVSESGNIVANSGFITNNTWDVVLEAGNYEVELTVEAVDNDGFPSQDTDVISILVEEPNESPNAVLTITDVVLQIPNVTGVPGNETTVILNEYYDDENSGPGFGEEGDDFDFFWLNSENTQVNAFVILGEGTFNYTLVLTDSYGASDSASLTLTLVEENIAPIVEIIDILEIGNYAYENSIVVIESKVTDTDNCDENTDDICVYDDLYYEFNCDSYNVCQDNNDPVFLWSTNQEEISLSSLNDLTTSFVSPELNSNDDVYSFEITFIATDPFFAKDTATKIINIYNENQPPLIITEDENGDEYDILSIIEGSIITLSVFGSEILLEDTTIARISDPDSDTDFSLNILDGQNYYVNSNNQIVTLSGDYDQITIPLFVSDDQSAPIPGTEIDNTSEIVEIVVNILEQNDAPVITIPDDYFIWWEDSTDLIIDGISFSDEDAGTNDVLVKLFFDSDTDSTDGEIKLNNHSGLTFYDETESGDLVELNPQPDIDDYSSKWIIKGIIPSLNNAFEFINYKVIPGYIGADLFTIYINDLGYSGFGNIEKTDEKDIQIMMLPMNDVPIPFDEEYEVGEDLVLDVSSEEGILINEYLFNVDDETLYATLVDDVSHGILFDFNADGSFTYYPDENYYGTDAFTYLINDSLFTSIDVATTTITIYSINDNPVANTDEYPQSSGSLMEDGSITVSSSNGILSNDTDVESSFYAILVDDVNNGTLGLNEDGSFTYVPNDNFFTNVIDPQGSPQESFDYKVIDIDGAESPIATVKLNITPVNDPPNNVEIPYMVGGNQSGSINAAYVGEWNDATDTDIIPAGSGLTYEYKWQKAIDNYGTNLCTINVTDSSSYGQCLTSNQDESGLGWVVSNEYLINNLILGNYLRVIVRATDTGGEILGEPYSLQTEQASLYKHINNSPPVVVNDDYSFNEDDTLVVEGLGVIYNDSDIDNDQLYAILFSEPLYGELSLDSSGSFTYYAYEKNWNGDDQFIYKLYDGFLYAADYDTVSITVIPVNDYPEFSIDGDVNLIGECGDGVSSHTSEFLCNADPSSHICNCQGNWDHEFIEDNFTQKIITITPNTDIIPDDELSEDVSYSLSPSPDQIDYMDIQIDENYGTVTISVLENGNTGFESDFINTKIKEIKLIATDNGFPSPASFEQSFYLTIQPINDAPSFQINVTSIDRAEDFSDSPSILVTPDPITYGENIQTVVYTLSPYPQDVNWADIDFDENTGNVSINSIQNGNTSGNEEIFTIYAQDNGGMQIFPPGGESGINFYEQSFSISIDAVNDPPIFSLENNNIVINEDSPSEIIQLNLDPIPIDELADSIIFLIEPIDSIISSNLATIEIDVSPINSDGGIITYNLIADQFGIDQYRIIADDRSGGSETYTQFLSITVNSVNDAPTISSIPDSTILEDTDIITIPFSNIFVGALNENQEITINAISNNPNVIPDPIVNYFSPNESGELKIYPIENQTGQVIISVYVIDSGSGLGENQTIETFNIYVLGTNDPPIAVEDNYSTNEDIPLTIYPFQSILNNDIDIDNDPLQISSHTFTDFGELSIDSTSGTFVYNPMMDWFGTDFFSYTIIDIEGYESDPITVTISVLSVNDPPDFELSNNYIHLEEDFLLQENIFLYPFSLPYEELSQITMYSLSPSPSEVNYVDIDFDENTGNFSMTSVNNENTLGNEKTFWITAIDDGDTINNGINIQAHSFIIKIDQVNDPPEFEILPMNIEVNEDFVDDLTFPILAEPTPFDEVEQTVEYSLIDFQQEFVNIYLDTSLVDNNIITNLIINSIADGNTQSLTDSLYLINIRGIDNGGTDFGGVDFFDFFFELKINPVNDAPEFTIDSLIVLDEDNYDSYTFSPTIGHLPIDEQNQIVSYIIEPDFSTVDFANINLSTGGLITISEVENGNTAFMQADSTQYFTITAIDDAGMVFGGVDTFQSFFNIKINPVNDPPYFSVQDTTLNEDFDDTVLVNIDIANIPIDEESQGVMYEIVEIDPVLANIEINEQNGQISITSILNQYGESIVTIKSVDDGDTINDGIDSYLYDFHLSIQNENDPPLIYGPSETINAFEDIDTLVQPINIEDTDAYDFPLLVHMSVNKGTISLNNIDSLSFIEGDGLDDTSIVLKGNINNLNSALASIVYRGNENYNGIDTLYINTNDLGHSGYGELDSLEDNWLQSIFIEQVNDAPQIELVSFQNGLTKLPEDTSDVEFNIDYFDIDSDSNLNYSPVSTDSLYWTFSKLGDEPYQRVWASENNEIFVIDSLKHNFNGPTGLHIIALDNGNGDSNFELQGSYDFIIEVEQRNDELLNFSLLSELDNYSIDTTSFYYIEDVLYFRLPQDINGVSNNTPEKIRFAWEKNNMIDPDIDPELNLGDSLNLFYRLEAILNDSLYLVLKDSINHGDFSMDTMIFTDINIVDNFSFYSDNYLEILDNGKIELDITGNTAYKWRVVAQNYWLDNLNNDPPQISFGIDDSEFRIDLIKPKAKFLTMYNHMYPDYYDLFLSSDEPLLSEYSILFLDLNDSFQPRRMEDSLYHYTGVFSDTGTVSFDFYARDRVRNVGLSSDSISFQIVYPNSSLFINSPTGSAVFHFPKYTVNQSIGMIISEISVNESNLERNDLIQITPIIQVQPHGYHLDQSASIRFDISQFDDLLYHDYQFKIYVIEDNDLVELPTNYHHSNVFSIIDKLSSYVVFVDPSAKQVLPTEFLLGNNYPNPFNPITIIPIEIPYEAEVTVSIFNILGQEVTTLLNGIQSPGYYNLKWSGKSQNGNNVSSGIYFVRAIYENQISIKKIMLLK